MGEIFTPVVHINAQEFLNSTTHRDLTNRAVLPSGPARLQYKHPLSQTENRLLKQNLTPQPRFMLHARNTFAEYTIRLNWVVPEKIHTPPTEEISAIRRGRGHKIVSDNSKCIRISEGGRWG